MSSALARKSVTADDEQTSHLLARAERESERERERERETDCLLMSIGFQAHSLGGLQVETTLGI